MVIGVHGGLAKDSELRQATTELESQLRLAAASLSEYKLRTANAETRLAESASDATRSEKLDRELREKNQVIGKLRHDGELVLSRDWTVELTRTSGCE